MNDNKRAYVLFRYKQTTGVEDPGVVFKIVKPINSLNLSFSYLNYNRREKGFSGVWTIRAGVGMFLSRTGPNWNIKLLVYYK